MSIVLPPSLPAARVLRAEGLDVRARPWTTAGPGRPLRIGLLNLMPAKAATETQFARLLAAAPVAVELSLILPAAHAPRTEPAHAAAFYARWPAVRAGRLDGLIVTGAPVETLAFAEVDYWDELRAIMDWTQGHVGATLYVCWAAQAALQHFHGVPKHPLARKMFGVFPHRVTSPRASLTAGLRDGFPVPVSRHTEVRRADLPAGRGLEVLADSPESGLCLIEDRPRRAVYMFNHLEYDAGTLAQEYVRDRAAGLPTAVPRNYFPGDDPTRPPRNVWRGAAQALFGNWLGALARARAHEGIDRAAA